MAKEQRNQEEKSDQGRQAKEGSSKERKAAPEPGSKRPEQEAQQRKEDKNRRS